MMSVIRAQESGIHLNLAEVVERHRRAALILDRKKSSLWAGLDNESVVVDGTSRFIGEKLDPVISVEDFEIHCPIVIQLGLVALHPKPTSRPGNRPEVVEPAVQKRVGIRHI